MQNENIFGIGIFNNEYKRQRELFKLFGIWNRLISFYDTITGNNIYQVLELRKQNAKIKHQ